MTEAQRLLADKLAVARRAEERAVGSKALAGLKAVNDEQDIALDDIKNRYENALDVLMGRAEDDMPILAEED